MMECYASRSTTTLSTFILLFAIAAIFNYVSSFLFTQAPTGRVELQHVVDMTVHPYLQADQSHLRFFVEGDFSSAFQWNTHQLFAYIFVRYNTTNYVRNEVIIWDSIISNVKRAKFNYTGIFNKYPLRSVGRELRGKTIELVLAYRYMPVVGLMKEHIVTSSHVQLPQQYFYASQKDHDDARLLYQQDD